MRPGTAVTFFTCQAIAPIVLLNCVIVNITLIDHRNLLIMVSSNLVR